MMKINDISTAISLFVEAASKHAEATEQGDYKTGNKNYKRIVAIVSFIKKHNSLKRLEELLNHSSVGVRMWAAVYLLPLSEKEAIKVLKEIISRNGIHSLTAETTLSEWKKGNLIL